MPDPDHTDPAASANEARARLLALFEAAVQAAHPDTCLAPHLPALGPGERLLVLGAGKAAAAMAAAIERHFAASGALARICGSVATRHGYGVPTRRIAIIEAGHPIPDEASLAAGRKALDLAGTAAPEDRLLVLLSGGASALWAVPLPGFDLAAKQAITKGLLEAGARIADINCVRKHLSAIKGGGLARAAGGRAMLTLAISDVPGDDPAAIGSGPTVGDPTTLDEAIAIAEKHEARLPAGTVARIGRFGRETPAPDDPLFARSRYVLVARPRDALAAAARKAEALGYGVEMLGDALEGEARDLARQHAARARAHLAAGRRVALISGGEATVTVRGTGRGGPNQEYALALALALDSAPGITALAADTDGSDGGRGAADDPAGALVFPDTLARAAARDLNAAIFLENNDSTGFFGALGDLMIRGPTLTNVNDFRVILVDPPA